MKTIYLRVGIALASGILFALSAGMAQEAQPATKPVDTGRLTVERDNEKEDQVAKLFEGVRAEAKIPQLQRIKHRADLEQQVCTSALTDKALKFGIDFYTTDDPESITPELRKIASFNRFDSNKRPWYARYSVAVWRVKDLQEGKVSYRVGVRFYGTALSEFMDCHFTDDVHYCGMWKASIAPACRGK